MDAGARLAVWEREREEAMGRNCEKVTTIDDTLCTVLVDLLLIFIGGKLFNISTKAKPNKANTMTFYQFFTLHCTQKIEWERKMEKKSTLDSIGFGQLNIRYVSPINNQLLLKPNPKTKEMRKADLANRVARIRFSTDPESVTWRKFEWNFNATNTEVNSISVRI